MIFIFKKLILHRASMKFYEKYLIQNDILVEYFKDESYFKSIKNEEIFVYELFDNYLEKKYIKLFKYQNSKNPNFINQKIKINFYTSFISIEEKVKYFHERWKTSFDKYSFDDENRKNFQRY